MAPTGVAAININGTTIHTALAIPKEAGTLTVLVSRVSHQIVNNGRS